MATRDSKLKGRPSRSRTPGDRDKGKPPAPSAASRASPDKGFKHSGNANRQASEERLIEIVDEERTHLAQAEAILDCLHIALTHAEEQDVDDNDRPYFPYVADIARKLVRQSVHRLDSLYLGPRLRRAAAAAAAA
jgi:hypothetical protein